MYTLYKIACSANGKAYIGYTSKTAEERFQTHLLNAKWKRKTALYNAIRKYGPEAFSVKVLLVCADHVSACEQEVRLIAETGCLLPAGYNMTTGGDGVPLTEEQRAAAGAKNAEYVARNSLLQINVARDKKRLTRPEPSSALRERGANKARSMQPNALRHFAKLLKRRSQQERGRRPPSANMTA